MKTNVLVVVMDALRFDRVGVLGGRNLTPMIDDLAEEAAVFTNAYSTTNVTDVAVTSIQTGRYPLSHGVINHGMHVTNEEKNIVEKVVQLPQVLSKTGYRTAKFGRPLGRWHRNGFDIYPSSMEGMVAFDENDNAKISVNQLIGDSLERLHPQLRKIAFKIYQNSTSRTKNVPHKQEYIDKIRDGPDDVVENFREFIQGPTPFYSFIHLMNTHNPYIADPELVKSYLHEYDYRTDISMRGTSRHPDGFDDLVKAGEYPKIEEKYYLSDGTPTTAITDAHYDASVTEGDKRIGEIINILQEEGLYEDTLVVVLSDHGESLTEHGIYHDHHGLYDVSTHIPLIIRPPDGSGKEINELVQITDISPTIESYVDSSGLDADGYSLQSAIEENENINRQYVLAEEAHTQRRRMIRSDKRKLIYSLNNNTICRYCNVQHASEIELYNIIDDPNELRNVAKKRKDDTKKLRELSAKKAEEFKNRRPSRDSDAEITYEDEEGIKRRLEALGYR